MSPEIFSTGIPTKENRLERDRRELTGHSTTEVLLAQTLGQRQQAKERSGLRHSVFSNAKRWFREPLLHFMLLGLALFGMYAYMHRGRGGVESSKQIALTMDDLRQMDLSFASRWQRPPTPQEFQGMVEDKIREEILYREGLAMGLDKDDIIVKRRMAQKMQFLAEDVARAHEPSSAELKAWFEKNSNKFALPSRYSFRHLYFSPDRRGNNAQDDATRALATIAGQPEDSKLAISLADPFMFQDYYGDRARDALAKEFGPQFLVALKKLKPGSWQGPIESGYGWHLVFVDTVNAGHIPALEEIESDVKTAWLGEQKQEAWQETYKEMRAKYTVLLPAPSDKDAAQVPVPPPKKQVLSTSDEAPQTRFRTGFASLTAFVVLAVSLASAHEARPAYLEIKETSPGQFSVLWRTPVLAGMRLPVVLELPDDVKNLREPSAQELADSFVERRWIDAGPNGLAGKRIKFPGLQLTITDVLVRVEMLDGRKWTSIIHPPQPWVEIAASQTWMGVAGTYIAQGIRHILFGADHMLFVLGLLLIVKDRWMLLKTVTAFTVAHSITLAIATLGYANVPVVPLNAAIALSILFLGPEIVRSWRLHDSPSLGGCFCLWTAPRVWLCQRANQRRTSAT